MNIGNVSVEPMDVDTSSNSVNKMDISDNDNVAKKPIKKYHILLERRERKEYRFQPFLLPSVAICVALSILAYQVVKFQCCELDLQQLKETLSNNLFGQAKAVNAILNMLEVDVSTKILVFYGGTGVGKTYTTTLILEPHWDSSNIYHYTVPSFVTSFSNDFLLGLTICKKSILVVDDVNIKDTSNVKPLIVDFIEKAENLGKYVTIILIYNCHRIDSNYVKICDNSFYEELQHNHNDLKAVKQYVKFELLTEAHLRQCIEKELNGNQFTEIKMENVLKSFNVSLDGCKSVHNKIKMLNVL